MDTITAVADAVRDPNALCSVYVDTTQCRSSVECLSEICHQFVHRHVVGEPDVVGTLINQGHPLHTVATDCILKAASTLVNTATLEYLQCRPWVNFFNSVSSNYSVSLMARHAVSAKVGTPTFAVCLTKDSPDSGIKAHASLTPKTKDMYREVELAITSESDLRSVLKHLDLSTLNTLGTGLLMSVNGCRTLVTGDNLSEFGNSTDILTQQWQEAVTDRLKVALEQVEIDPEILAQVNHIGTDRARFLAFTIWFESNLT